MFTIQETPKRKQGLSIAYAWAAERGITDEAIDAYHAAHKYFSGEDLALHFGQLEAHKKNKWLFPSLLRLAGYTAVNVTHETNVCRRLWRKKGYHKTTKPAGPPKNPDWFSG